jgi:folate-binding protein YgfZ
MPSAVLPSRAVIRVSGKEAQGFLHNLVTTDIEGLPEREARPGALLTPQGKILFDFMIWRDIGQGGASDEDGDAFLIETDLAQRDGLIRRLTMYKLRAAVTIAADAEGVTVFWGEDVSDGTIIDGAFAKAGIAVSRSAGTAADALTCETAADAYRALRIAAGLAVSGDDFALQDAFPHDVLLDRTGGLSFRKGCYVGQEVVSRMQHRGTARRRVVSVSATGPLPAPGTDILAGEKPVGTLGSVSGTNGLAIVRTDRVGDAMSSGTPLTVGGLAVTLSLPSWSGLEFPSASDAAEP